MSLIALDVHTSVLNFFYYLAITGYDHKGVISVYTQITLLVSTVRKRLSKTHFISVPLSSCDIKARFLEFQRDVLDLKVIILL